MLQTIPDLELAVTGLATQESDWDIAIRWQKHIQGLGGLQYGEALKQKLAATLHVHIDQLI